MNYLLGAALVVLIAVMCIGDSDSTPPGGSCIDPVGSPLCSQ